MFWKYSALHSRVTQITSSTSYSSINTLPSALQSDNVFPFWNSLTQQLLAALEALQQVTPRCHQDHGWETTGLSSDETSPSLLVLIAADVSQQGFLNDQHNLLLFRQALHPNKQVTVIFHIKRATAIIFPWLLEPKTIQHAYTEFLAIIQCMTHSILMI